jgi:hypothetical protein
MQTVPALNWLELEQLVKTLEPGLSGLFVEGVNVPERPHFPDGYLRDEWSIRLSSRTKECALVFSVRARHPYITLLPGKGPRASTRATQPPFGLAIAKHLKSRKITDFATFPRERVAMLWFDNMALALVLIPAAPEALLVRGSRTDASWEILARSRAAFTNGDRYTPPDGTKAPEAPPLRVEFSSYSKLIYTTLEYEAFETRLTAAGRALRQNKKQASERLRQSETALRESQAEPDWQRFGDLLKSVLHAPPALIDGKRRIQDLATDEWVEIPGDPRYGAREQTERFYQQSRRRARRISEAGLRMEDAKRVLARLEKIEAQEPAKLDWAALAEIEREVGINQLATGDADKKEGKRGSTSWPGRRFISRDGLPIHIGRTKDENLELTFKYARGNDLWLHVRGQPSAHAIIRLPAGKSAPLETLLDAANLILHFSGARQGKTEVDYTFKKHVKRIRDSSEASYTGNKTLIIEPDPERIRRLLA